MCCHSWKLAITTLIQLIHLGAFGSNRLPKKVDGNMENSWYSFNFLKKLIKVNSSSYSSCSLINFFYLVCWWCSVFVHKTSSHTIEQWLQWLYTHCICSPFITLVWVKLLITKRHVIITKNLNYSFQLFYYFNAPKSLTRTKV